jgi:Rieske Fe-S protein
MIFRDMITGVKNPWADMVDARRWDVIKTASSTIQETIHTQKHLISDKIKARFAPNIDTLKPGEGGTVKAGGEIVGAYLDKTGKYHLVTPVCTHLGCNVLFNVTDRTWESVARTGTRHDPRVV